MADIYLRMCCDLKVDPASNKIEILYMYTLIIVLYSFALYSLTLPDIGAHQLCVVCGESTRMKVK